MFVATVSFIPDVDETGENAGPILVYGTFDTMDALDDWWNDYLAMHDASKDPQDTRELLMESYDLNNPDDIYEGLDEDPSDDLAGLMDNTISDDDEQF